MRRQIIVVFCSLLLLAFGPVAAAERGALFQVTANGHTLHLFGTMHAGRPDYYPLEPRIRAALMAAPTLVLEIDAARDLAAMMAAMREHGMFAPGSAGRAALSVERRARIESALKKNGVDLASSAQPLPINHTPRNARCGAKLGFASVSAETCFRLPYNSLSAKIGDSARSGRRLCEYSVREKNS